MERAQDFPVGTEELWAALTEDDQLSAWLGDEVEVELRPGGQGRVLDGDEQRRLVVDDVEDGRRLSFTWWTEQPDTTGSGMVAGPPTHVELLVVPASGGSRLIVRETVPYPGRWASRVAVLSARLGALARV